jgi:hypothetical protein
MQMKLLGITSVDFDVIDQQLITVSISGRYWRKKGVEWYSALAVHRFQESLRFG